MNNRGWKETAIITGAVIAAILTTGTVWARQNILIGEVSVRYDHQDRTYDNDGVRPEVPTDSDGEAVTQGAGDGRRVIVFDDREGDRRDYILSPRLTFSSTGINDVIELTYAPGVNYDDIDETTDLDHDFRLRMEKNMTRNWLVKLSNRFFLGEDPVRAEQRRTADIVPGSGVTAAPEPVVGSPAAEPDQALTERFGRRRYWTNAMDVGTEYTYGEDRLVSVGYTFNVLRNDDSDAAGGYTDYDRHSGDLLLHHRFSRKLSAEGEAGYSRGLFDEPDIFVVTPPSAPAPSGEGAQEPSEATPAVRQLAGDDSDDIKEYSFRIRGGYDKSAHLNLFTEYSYLGTDYDSTLREDSDIHNVALGFDYDITSRLHATMSAGPSWVNFENRSTETDYNAHAGLSWDYMHGVIRFFADKSYNTENFDGRRSGLTDSWNTGVSLDYQFTRDLTAAFSATYAHDDRLQLPIPQTIVVVDDDQTGEPRTPEDFSEVQYTERDYDVGITLSYTFLRWYTLSGGYRYYNFDTDSADSGYGPYHEHRAFIEMTFSKEMFRW